MTSKPDEGTLTGKAESVLEKIAQYQDELPLVAGHSNVALLTLGNSRSDPRTPGKIINSETYIHSKNMAVLGQDWAQMTGGSGNIAFTSMWFHSEMNITFADTAKIKNWVAQLWSEHLQVSVEIALGLIENPANALSFFNDQATHNLVALQRGWMPKGRIYYWGTVFPKRELDGISLGALPAAEGKSMMKNAPLIELEFVGEDALSRATDLSYFLYLYKATYATILEKFGNLPIENAIESYEGITKDTAFLLEDAQIGHRISNSFLSDLGERDIFIAKIQKGKPSPDHARGLWRCCADRSSYRGREN